MILIVIEIIDSKSTIMNITDFIQYCS